MKRRSFRPVVGMLGVLLIVAGILNVAPAPKAEAVGTTHWPISGAGSTWSSNALEQWVRNVWSNYQWKITFDPSGSSAGRQLFGQGTVDFAVSEIPYELSGGDALDPRPIRRLAYMPIVAGGTAFMYNLQIGGQRVTNLRLSGEVITKIFTNVITSWDDPAIKADNPGLALPAIPIVPVIRSDGSGTSAQFTSWMRDQYPTLWNNYCAAVGRGATCGITSNYPSVPGSKFVARSGSNSVSGYVAQPHAVGAITYVEYSYALNSGYPVAKVLNSGGFYTEPTASNVAVALLGARINEDETSPDYLTQDLRGVYTSGDPRTYPLSSYSYMIIPTALENGFTEDKGLTLADFGSYFLCEGQQQAEVLGYSPLPINLVQAGQSQIKKIPGGNPQIGGIESCNNPTFSPDGSNKLANEAPYPAACDQIGPTQCTTGTGGAKGEETGNSGGGGGGSGSGSDDGAGGGAGGAAGGGEAGGGQGGSGSLGGDSGIVDANAKPVLVNGSPQSLPQTTNGVLATFAMLAAGCVLLALAVLPPILGRRRRNVSLPTTKQDIPLP